MIWVLMFDLINMFHVIIVPLRKGASMQADFYVNLRNKNRKTRHAKYEDVNSFSNFYVFKLQVKQVNLFLVAPLSHLFYNNPNV